MITFTETTGILDKDDIRRKMRMWQFDSSSSRVTKTWWINDAEFKCENEEYDNTIPLTIQSFTNRYLDASVGRCATLNGPEHYVLIKDGDWDKPLHDGDLVGMVPSVGVTGWDDVIYWAYVAIMAATLAYAIYMIATMKTGDGSAASTIYSLSSTTNNKRPGEIIERQYGYLKRYPSYAANPYTIYENNQQWLYAVFCLGQGKFSGLKFYAENTDLSEYDDVTINVVQPYGSAGYFDNNVVTSAEVSDLQLFATNQHLIEETGWPASNDGKWQGPFNANSVGTETTKLLLDFEFPSGLHDAYANGDKIYRTVTWEVQYRSMTKQPDGSIEYGSYISVNYSKRTWRLTPLRYTYTINVPSGAYQVRARRTSIQYDGEGRGVTTLKWRALRAKLPNISTFGNKTIVMLKAKAQDGLSDSAAKRFCMEGTAYSPVYDATTKAWTDTPNRNPVWAMCDMMRSSNGGHYPDSLLALDHLATWAKWCDDNGVYFDYCFDGQSDIFSQLNVAARVMRASVIFTDGQLHILRDEPITIPAAMFTKENIVDGSFKIQYKGATSDDYGGLRVEYADPDDDWNTNTVDCILAGSSGANLKTTTMKGCTDRTRAYRLGMYEWSTEMENRAAISFDTTITGWQTEPGTMIYVNHPLFRQHTSGQIISIDGTTVVLSCNVKLNSGYNNVLKIRDCKTGGVLGTYTVTYSDFEGGDYHTLTLDSAPNTSGMVFTDPQALPIFALGISSDFAKKCRVTKTQNKAEGTSIECFIDTDARFSYDASYPDTGIPSENPHSSISVFSDGIDGPVAFAWDSHGQMYVSANESGAVYKINSDGTNSVFASGIKGARAMAFDSNDNLFVSSWEIQLTQVNTNGVITYTAREVGLIYKISTTGSIINYASDVGRVYSILVDSDGTLYLSSNTKNCIFKVVHAVDREVGAVSTVVSGIYSPCCMVWSDDKNSIYLASSGSGENGKVSIIAKDGSSSSVLASGLGPVFGIVKNSVGNIYATRYDPRGDDSTGVWEILPDGTFSNYANIFGAHDISILDDVLYVGSMTENQVYSVKSKLNVNVIASGVSEVHGVSFDPSGILWIAGHGSDSVYKLVLSVTPDNPEDVTVIPYDPTNSGSPTDITISWNPVNHFDTYIVQYSQDGETWTTVTASTTSTSVRIGSYLAGNFYARVAVVYNGRIWKWGISAATWMPVSTTGFIYVTSDNFIDTTADSYKYVSQG